MAARWLRGQARGEAKGSKMGTLGTPPGEILGSARPWPRPCAPCPWPGPAANWLPWPGISYSTEIMLTMTKRCAHIISPSHSHFYFHSMSDFLSMNIYIYIYVSTCQFFGTVVLQHLAFKSLCKATT